MKVVALNFKADAPTVNGRIYDRESLKVALEKRLQSNFFIYGFSGNKADPSLMDMIAKVTSYEIKEDGTILLTSKFLPNIIDDLHQYAEFTLATIGTVGEDKHVTNMSISHAYITPKLEVQNGDSN